jgi:putative spermidine/putrescine transport system substrate-binding protein
MSHSTAPVRRRDISRRAVTVAAGTLPVAMLLAACGSSSDTSAAPSDTSSPGASAKLSGSVVFADFGGPTHDRRSIVFLEPFTKDSGVKVVSADLADAMMATMLDGGIGDYDIIQASVGDIYNHKVNLVELPATRGIDNVLPADVQPYALGTFGVADAQGWLTKTFPDGGPASWADFWDFTKFPGKRAIPGLALSVDYMFEAALMADGVKPADLYPLDLKRAVKKLGQLKGHVVFYTEYPDIQQLLASGTASIAFGPTGFYAALNRAGAKTSITWNQALLEQNVFVIPKGAPHKVNAIALADYFGDPKKQAAFAQLSNYSPGNKAALALIPAKTLANLATSPENEHKVIQVDVKSRAASHDAMVAKYGAWLATVK